MIQGPGDHRVAVTTGSRNFWVWIKWVVLVLSAWSDRQHVINPKQPLKIFLGQHVYGGDSSSCLSLQHPLEIQEICSKCLCCISALLLFLSDPLAQLLNCSFQSTKAMIRSWSRQGTGCSKSTITRHRVYLCHHVNSDFWAKHTRLLSPDFPGHKTFPSWCGSPCTMPC